MFTFRFLSIATAASVLATQAIAQYEGHAPWPKFHANNSNSGIGAGKGSTGALKWRFQTQNAVESTPAIGYDGTLYVGSDDGNLYAINPSTGTTKWVFTAPGGNGVACIVTSPAIGRDGTLYFGSLNGYFYAVDSATGIKKWQYHTFGVSLGSPAIGPDGTIYLCTYNSLSVIALNPDGTLKWSQGLGICGASPAVGSDGTVYMSVIPDPSAGFFALDGQTGAVKWNVSNISSHGASPAIASDGTVYFGSDDDYVYALNGATGAQVWSFKTGGQVESSPVIGPDGTLYIGSNDGTVYALNGQTGMPAWTFATGATSIGGLAMAGDGTLYFGAGDNNIYAIDSSTGKEKWQYATGSLVDCNPSIASDGTVYVGSFDTYLYAFSAAALKNFYCTSTTIQGGNSIRLVVQSSAAGPSGYTVNLQSDNAAIPVPNAVTIPSNTTILSFLNSTAPVDSTQTVNLTASIGTSSLHAAVTVTPASLSTVIASPLAVTGGSAASAIVVLTGAAGPSGTGVSLSYGTDVSGPPNATVPALQSRVTVPLTTSPVSSSEQVTISATLGAVTKQTHLTLNPAPVSLLTVSPSPAIGGSSPTGTVTLNGAAGPSGEVVSIGSSSPYVQVPGTVPVQAGMSSASFSITTMPVTSSIRVSLIAIFGRSYVRTSLVLNPAPLTSISVAPSSVTGGSNAGGTVTLLYNAGYYGDVVTLSSSDPSAKVPVAVGVSAGANTAPFTVRTLAVSSSTSVTLTASKDGASKTTILTVTPHLVSHFAIKSVNGGQSAQATIQLSGPAGPSGNAITLSSPDPHVAVPATVTVPAGKTALTFSVSTLPVTSTIQVTVTASFGGATTPATVTLSP